MVKITPQTHSNHQNISNNHFQKYYEYIFILRIYHLWILSLPIWFNLWCKWTANRKL